MKNLLLFVLLISCISSKIDAQILGINEPLFSDRPFFNTKFIKTNNIKSITGTITSKKVKDIIRSKGLKTLYTFNSEGRLKMQLSAIKSSNKLDTTITFYTYNNTGEIKLKRKSDGEGYFSYNYRYNSKNQVISQTYSRDENQHNDKINFLIKKKYIIKTDSFSYENYSPKQFKKIFYNSYGIKYKEQINTYDELGYLIEEYTKFIIGSNKRKVTYTYDQYGRLSKMQTYSSNVEPKTITNIYSYDEVGNVLQIESYKNEKHTTTKQFLYNEKTMLLSAIIDQEIASHLLTITKYDYTFFDGSTNLSNINRDTISNNQ